MLKKLRGALQMKMTDSDLRYSEVPLKGKNKTLIKILGGGGVNAGRPLQVKYWGVATPATPAALTPMPAGVGTRSPLELGGLKVGLAVWPSSPLALPTLLQLTGWRGPTGRAVCSTCPRPEVSGTHSGENSRVPPCLWRTQSSVLCDRQAAPKRFTSPP